MRVYNFSAGPATLPLSVLEAAKAQLTDYEGTGQSVMEMSHRSPAYDEIHRGALAALRRLLGSGGEPLGEDYEVLLLQGGASLQFSMVPMNLMGRGPGDGRTADYVLTGAWSKKALKEARREGEARVAGSTEESGFDHVPGADELDLEAGADYVHVTTNNTIFGTQWHDEHLRALEAAYGDGAGPPLVADASSDILCRPRDVSRFGLIYAGAQKNLGPAGVTLVIVRRDLVEAAPETLPTMLQYRTHAAKDSMFNTPPTWAIYMLGLACKWLEDNGGTAAMGERNREKAAALYAAIDGSDFYRGTVQPASRSLMNVPFRLPSQDLEAKFLAEAADNGLVNLKGHRSVGGIRASIYNAMPLVGVEALIDLMADFERRNG